jgi:hypothetical protein
MLNTFCIIHNRNTVDRDSSVGIATAYGLSVCCPFLYFLCLALLSFLSFSHILPSGDRIPVEARFSAPVQTGPEAHPVSCTMGTGSFPGLMCGRGVTLAPHPLLVPRPKTEQSYTSTIPKGLCGL